MKQLKHLHMLVKVKVREPKALDSKQLVDWVNATVREQGLEPVAGPFVTMVTDEGNEGPTGGVHIKTSHMAFHIWDNRDMIQADLYTCGDLNVRKFINAFDVFDIELMEYLVLDRANGFQVLKAGKIRGFDDNELYLALKEQGRI